MGIGWTNELIRIDGMDQVDWMVMMADLVELALMARIDVMVELAL